MTDIGAHFATLNPLTAFGIVLALGILGGQLATRNTPLPAITGYTLTGLVIGPHGIGLISQPLLNASDLFVQLALGLALFEQGRRLDLYWLRRERALFITALIGGALCFAVLWLLLNLAGLPAPGAAIVASLALASSPAALLEVMRQTRAEGQVSERVIGYAGIGNLLALAAFVVSIGAARASAGLGVEATLLQPGWMLLGSAAIGVAAGLLSIRLNLWIGAARREAEEVLLFALVALTVGLCAALHLLPALALLCFGLSTRNLRRGYAVSSPYLLRYSVVFFVALFVSTGARLDLAQLAAYLWLAPLLVVARSALTALTCWTLARANGIAPKNGLWMGLALMPMSSNTGVLLLASGALIPQASGDTLAMIVAMLCLTEIAGPVLTRVALARCGETHE